MTNIYYCLRSDETNFYLCAEANDLNLLGAQVCAENFHTEHDGWEYEWPIEIGLSRTPHGPAEKWFEVSLGFVPDFIVEEIEPEEVME